MRTGWRVVARRNVERYSPPVHKFFWQRLALIFLLVSRLVIGELGHAMPMDPADHMSAAGHHQMSADMTSDATDHAGCPEHEQSKQHVPTAPHVADDSGHSSTKKDCCKSGACECPCLHVPCAALDELVLSPVAMTLLHIPQGADGLLSLRPSSPFRPPA